MFCEVPYSLCIIASIQSLISSSHITIDILYIILNGCNCIHICLTLNLEREVCHASNERIINSAASACTSRTWNTGISIGHLSLSYSWTVVSIAGCHRAKWNYSKSCICHQLCLSITCIIKIANISNLCRSSSVENRRDKESECSPASSSC